MMFQTISDYYKADNYNTLIQLATVGVLYKTFAISCVCNYTKNKAKRIGIIVNELYINMEDEKVQQQVS